MDASGPGDLNGYDEWKRQWTDWQYIDFGF